MLKKNLKLKKTISELEDIPLKLSKIKHVWKKDGQLMHKTYVEIDELESLLIKKLYVTKKSEYANKEIKELSLDKKTHIISVKREGEYLTPNGSLKLLPYDQILFSEN